MACLQVTEEIKLVKKDGQLFFCLKSGEGELERGEGERESSESDSESAEGVLTETDERWFQKRNASFKTHQTGSVWVKKQGGKGAGYNI